MRACPVRLARPGFALGCGCDQAEIVPEPLHRGPGHEDRAFERISPAPLDLMENRRQHARGRCDLLAPGVGEHKQPVP
jgi:hypothetical protein